ncbi:MAG: 2Fe-2S iron-sulfur cluster binding domain-containing protein [Deltaproteobacteria bacterium]|nr:MAG: 2Fe-2S iron-sulfur cluster binding domain-containing protein [Deltaproteobacteria bacterium]
MPKFTLDGREISFDPGETVMEAAWREGIEIPHYCWHPGLSVAANCRMCLVHVESGRQMEMPQLAFDEEKGEYVPTTKPKLQPACQLAAAEDIVVSSTNDEVKTAQASVQEFLLLNHPVDCPICDQAGECKLQDYYYEHQATLKRKLTEPVHKPKGVRFGPTIIYDAERCIMCTRCIRVCDEVAKDHVLDMRERGNKNEIVLAPGRELDHRYTLMTEHVCPVGALTSQDFRFKARVWFLKSGQGVCTGCATGCNTHVDYDPRYGKVYRLRPRDNADVNKYWMCDDGMMTYTRHDTDRLLMPTTGRGDERMPVGEDEALDLAAEKLKAVDASKLAVVLSAQHTTEDNLALAKLAAALGADRLYLAALGGWEGDDILRSDDNNPNRAGATQAAGGATLKSVDDLLADAQSGAVQGVVALGWASAEQLEELAPLTALDGVVSLTSHVGAFPAVASVAIPVADIFEIDGSFVNDKSMPQAFRPVLAPPTGVDPAWKTISALAGKLGKDLGFQDLQSLRQGLSDAVEAAQ